MVDRDTLISDNLRLVHSCCKRFRNRGVEYDDLYQAGCIGLIKAADGFDKERGFKFSTYAIPAILGEIKRIFRDGGTVKVGRTLKELSLKVNRANELLSKTFGREPTVGEISEYLQVEIEQVTEAICAAKPVFSLTVESDDGIAELELAEEGEEEKIVDRLAIGHVLSALESSDRKLIYMRYFAFKTQSETAKALGMTQVQVSRREKIILSQLKKMLA